MKKHCFLFAILFSTFLAAQNSYSPDFHLLVFKKDSITLIRIGSFLPTLAEPTKKNIDPFDPGSCGHLSVLIKDELQITGKNDSIENRLKTPGSYVYIFQNSDLLDSTQFLTLIADSTTADHFLAQIKKVRRREWETHRIIIQPRYTNRAKGIPWVIYLRFQQSIFTVNLPDKNNRETMQIKSISPTIPVVHIGNIDYTHYTIGAGLSFNFGLLPRRPLVRLAADLLGPISVEWMFSPIKGFHDALALHTSAIGLFFNSGYGVFHWGIAFYTATYSRAEAYLGINLVPVISLWQSRHKQRYRW
jgi:hypothetical protein